MTTNYPPENTPTEPTGPRDVPGDAAWGCLWWWWIIFLIIILIVWFGGWGWGSYGGWWFRGRRTTVPPPAPNPTVPGTSGAPANPAPPATHPIMRLVPPSAAPGADRTPTVALIAADWTALPPVG
jgi:hypothetical protein